MIIDGGNSNWKDTDRRVKELEEKGFLFVGAGVSGGEEGALNGPSIMPGGSEAAWEIVKPIFQSIAAKVEGNVPCCDWVGKNGSGHFVKMVHNGIEYGDMQLIAESYHIMKDILKMDNEEIADTYDMWNKDILDSYLIEISSKIFRKKEGDDYVVDLILDSAGQKGTGKWTAINALDLGLPLTLIAEAVFARCLSSMKGERTLASQIFEKPKIEFKGDKKTFLEDIKFAVYAAKLVSYAQGYLLMRSASTEYGWNLNYGGVALMWRGGCIIRSKFLGEIKKAFDDEPNLPNLLFNSFFADVMKKSEESWRRVVSEAIKNGIPVPCISSALAYFDGLRTFGLPANLIQAQRDFFGAHTYERIDKSKGEYFHTDWTGHGGSTHSNAYNV